MYLYHFFFYFLFFFLLQPDPQKRKSIHDREIPIDEMRDNDKNSAKMKLIHERDHGKLDSSDEDIVTSDEEDERETSPIINKEHTRIYNKDKRTENTRIRKKKLPERQANDTYNINADNLTFKRNIGSPPKYSPEKSRPRRNSNPSVKNDNTGYSIYTIGIVAIGVVLLVYFGYFSPNNSNTNSINSAKDNSENSPLSTAKLRIKNMRSKYKNQEQKLWETAYNSIREIINKPKTPSIILLLGNTSDPLSCLATVLGDISGKALDSHRVFLSPDKFDSDVGSVIENLRLKLQKNKAVVSLQFHFLKKKKKKNLILLLFF